MRRKADRERIERFLASLGQRARADATAFLSGGATAVLHGWRPSTIDIDLRLEPDADELLRPALDKDAFRAALERTLDG